MASWDVVLTRSGQFRFCSFRNLRQCLARPGRRRARMRLKERRVGRSQAHTPLKVDNSSSEAGPFAFQGARAPSCSCHHDSRGSDPRVSGTLSRLDLAFLGRHRRSGGLLRRSFSWKVVAGSKLSRILKRFQGVVRRNLFGVRCR